MSSLHFANRHRKDLSTNMIRTKIAHRKSLCQKENRHKEYERNRHVGLKDSNIPILENRILAPLDETSQLVPEKSSVKPRSAKIILDQRKEMLNKYKEEKQLQKLKEQREKAKRGTFKVGLYRPDRPDFLLSLSKPNTVTAEPKKTISSSVRITRSKAKEQMEQTKIHNGRTFQTIHSGQRPTSEKKVLEKEKKAAQLVVPTAVRMTRSATQAANQVGRAVSSTTIRKPVSRATKGNELERKSPNKGRSVKKTETKPDKDIAFKVNNEEHTLNSQTSPTNEIDPDGIVSKEENVPQTNTANMKGRNSFAPKDFMFQPLDGLKTYKAASLIPRRAHAFSIPSYTWSPLTAEVDETEEMTKEMVAQKCETHSAETMRPDSNTGQCHPSAPPVCKEEQVLTEKEATTKTSNGLPIKEVSSLETNEGQVCQPQHDVPYFRNILQSETEKLTSHCVEWDKKIELDIPDDAKDLIRTTIGQTRLLMKERFKQFEGLVDDCEYKRGEKETTCTDLDGFWDMVSFQIDDVNQKFNNLRKLEESEWQHRNTSKKVVRKKVVSSTASKPKQDDDGRLAARNRLAAIKNAMRERLKQDQQAEAAVSVVPKEVDTIVFDAGFFRIESPVKSFSGLSISSERRSQRLRTPKSVSKTMSQSRAEMNLLRQTTAPENHALQSTRSEQQSVDKILFSNTPDNRNSMVEDAQCPGLQHLIEVNHVNKINFEMDCLPTERMNLPLVAGKVADNINIKKIDDISDVVEGMELNSFVITQDAMMSSPEKYITSQSNFSQEEETKISQSLLFDNKILTAECHLLDSPDSNGSNPLTQLERRHQEHARHISFGGNLIAFSPLRPLSRGQPEEV
ncbi:PREDICTED: disks large-associated protein 5 [Chrysochloris asiatica]|uniref:Disks large-associated protein 5 n=1 Tax=Chrysochloris asiatica TaxID=185453 RepID=A0A9B0WRM2_CHRAS|nr:PREDICTED: disks large-associated protein 5 [Chrysochloris asiatica]